MVNNNYDNNDYKYLLIKNVPVAIVLLTAFICATIMGSIGLFGWTLFVTVMIYA